MTEKRPHYPFTRSSALNRQDALAGVRDKSVVKVTLPSGDQAYLITRHQDVQNLLADPRLRKDRKNPEGPVWHGTTPCSITPASARTRRATPWSAD
ncbi:hypothetical protein [Streptomyces sp. NPDC056632]|uniref:hypothetical protein n=1 Tax=Streptomyces sp. NPDC056632 TaxID=3345884 RepID=UPI0036C20EF9